ncbi:MAG: ssuC 6, partial [Clostridiales bacterium]|nr:ssuC 6 [Clostridiales bacterium]
MMAIACDKFIKRMHKFSYIYTFIFLAAAWQIVSMFTMLPFIPSPFRVVGNVYEIFLPKLLPHSIYSLYRIFTAVLISIMFGAPIGLAMGYSKSLDKIFSPSIYLLYPIPKIALLPIVMLILGLGDSSKIALITFILFFQVLVGARDAVRAIPSETFHSLHSLGATKIDLFRKILLPASLPSLLTSVRVGLGTALSVLFFTETFGTEHGLGFFVMDSWVRVNYVEMYSGIVALSILGLGL